MNPVQASGTIPVGLSVSRYEEFPADNMVQVWGHVGDYEVSVWLPADDIRVRAIRRPNRRRPKNHSTRAD